jgi:hypothetical protein
VRITKQSKFGLLGLLYSLFLICLSETKAFGSLGVPVMSPSFADLRLITSSASCFMSGHWTMLSISCDPWQRPFNYPSLWVKIFAFLGFGIAATNILGLIELGLLSTTLFYWIYILESRMVNSRQKLFFPVLVALLIFSPPFLLLAERGNVDILIFSGMTIVYELFRRRSYFLPAALLSFLGSLKIYPFVTVIAVVSLARSKAKLFYLFIAISIAVALTFGEFSLIAIRSESDWSSISYGVSVIPLLLLRNGFDPYTKYIAFSLGLILLIFIAGLILLSFKRFKNSFWLLKSMNQLEDFEVLFSASFFVSSFIVGTSYDYRLVTLFPFILLIYVSSTSNIAILAIFALQVPSMYFGHLTTNFGKFGLMLNVLGDLSISFVAGLAVALLWLSMKSKINIEGRSHV